MSLNKFIKSKRSKVISIFDDVDNQCDFPERNLWLEVYWKALHDIEFYATRYDYYSNFVKAKYKKKHLKISHEDLILIQMPHLITAIDFLFDDMNPIIELCYDNYDYILNRLREKALDILKSEPRMFELVKDMIN